MVFSHREAKYINTCDKKMTNRIERRREYMREYMRQYDDKNAQKRVIMYKARQLIKDIPEELEPHTDDILKCYIFIRDKYNKGGSNYGHLAYRSNKHIVYAISRYLNDLFGWGYTKNKFRYIFNFFYSDGDGRGIRNGNKLYRRIMERGAFPTKKQMEKMDTEYLFLNEENRYIISVIKVDREKTTRKFLARYEVTFDEKGIIHFERIENE